MTYYRDLSHYTYFPGEWDCLNIGWLDKDHAFLKRIADLNLEFVAKLSVICKEGRYKETRGYHTCPFCGLNRSSSAEIRVLGERAIYAAPEMVLHYVVEHSYSPPSEFIQAVFNTRKPLKTLAGLHRVNTEIPPEVVALLEKQAEQQQQDDMHDMFSAGAEALRKEHQSFIIEQLKKGLL